MKKLFFAIGILLSTGVNAQKTITVELPACFEFRSDISNASSAPVNGLKLESKISISDVRLGFNKHYFDLVNKKAHFTSNVDGEITDDLYDIKGLKIHNDTVSFYVDYKEVYAGDGKSYTYKSYFHFALKPKSDYDIVYMNIWERPIAPARLEGTYTKKIGCVVEVKY
jgi:hypothetical protein